MKRLTLVACLALSAPLAAVCLQSPEGPALPAAVEDGDLSGDLSAGDWSGIRAAREANRHAAFAAEDGFEAYNHELGWSARFNGGGASISPDEGGWTWGLKLDSWGYEGHVQALDDPQEIRAQGQRVSRDWNDTLTEWWINDTRGFEHGFTVHAAPADTVAAGSDVLVFELEVLGGLQTEVTASQRGARFLAEDGDTLVTYDGLMAFDADGADLEARMEATGQGLRLVVNAVGARYPITVDPLLQGTYLKASNTDSSDTFGKSLAIFGDTIVVGANEEASSATGVNAGAVGEADNSAPGSGAAYVFVRSGSVWSQQAYLKASNTDSWDQFGNSVAISGETIVVGAYLEASNATGVNAGAAGEADNNDHAAGAAYVFVRSGSVWSQQAYLKASNTQAFDFFGVSVAISGDTIVVGASEEGSIATGVNPGAGAEANNSAVGAGAAYVFVRSGSVWSQQAYMKASNTDSDDSFGIAVAISGDTILVGAELESSRATGVNSGPAAEADDSAPGTGAAYVFVRSGTAWAQQAYLKASNSNELDLFGGSVAISADVAVVGAAEESSSATGVNPGAAAEADNSLNAAGAAYVFVRSGSAWSQDAYLKASNTGSPDRFGDSVAVSGDTIVVGAWEEMSRATGVNPGAVAEADDSVFRAGAAYVFVRSGSVQFQDAYLKASNTGFNDNFGFSVAVEGGTVLVGARRESSSATGANPGSGAEANNSASGAGAVYVFGGRHTIGSPICSPAIANSTGVPASMTAEGSKVALDNDVTFFAAHLPPSVMAILATSPNLGTVLGAGGGVGTLCISSPTLGRHGTVQADANGKLSFVIDLNAIPQPNSTTAVVAGDTRYWQFWYRDGATSNFTNAIKIDFQ